MICTTDRSTPVRSMQKNLQTIVPTGLKTHKKKTHLAVVDIHAGRQQAQPVRSPPYGEALHRAAKEGRSAHVDGLCRGRRLVFSPHAHGAAGLARVKVPRLQPRHTRLRQG